MNKESVGYMTTKKTNTTYSHLTYIALVAVSVTLLGVLMYLNGNLRNQIEERDVLVSLALTRQSYDNKKLLFCYDNDIRPCTDVAIKDWNDTHPDRSFEVLSYHQLVERSVQDRSVTGE